MKINPRFSNTIFSIVMVTGMSFVISLAMTILNTGIDDGFFTRWVSAWLVSFIVAYPTVLVITPIAQRITARLID